MTLPLRDYPDGRAQTWHPDPQGYAISQERLRHEQALSLYGENAVFALMWRVDDLEANLVTRCSVCYLSYGKIAEAYGQSAQEKCTNCYGTTFEGGYKAIIVRPALWDFNEADYRDNMRGEITIQTATVQTTGDFRLRSGDHIFRADGTRWRMQTISTNHLRTGFMTPGSDTPVGYNFGQVVRQDESSVAYLMPPNAATLATLDTPGQREPGDYSAIEDIRGPLT